MVHRVLGGPARPLDAATRAFFEPRLGHDLGGVRVHADGLAAESARAVDAAAYTVGRHVVFGAGRYRPETNEGRRLVAHELAHVAQQRAAAVEGGPIRVGDPAAPAEREADRAATRLVEGEHTDLALGNARGRTLRRQPGDDPGDPGPGPTYGNLPRDEPAMGVRRVRLKQIDGKWREILPNGEKRTATGLYDFVIQDDEIWAVKPQTRAGGVPRGHTEAARGGRVSWAGQVQFSNKGQVKTWNDASGHYRPASSLKQVAEKVGLPPKAFQQSSETAVRPRPTGVQLPVEQPRTRPTTSGPAKVGPGPPRTDELERRYGRKVPGGAGAGPGEQTKMPTPSATEQTQTPKTPLKSPEPTAKMPSSPHEPIGPPKISTRKVPAPSAPQRLPTTKPAPSAPSLAKADLELLTREAGTLRRLGGTVAKNLKVLLSPFVTVPLTISLELLRAISAVEMTESAVRGGGWILTAQVQQAKELAKGSGSLVEAYGDQHYHTELARLVDTALKNDEKFAALGVTAEYWSGVDLSEFCIRGFTPLSEHVHGCESILNAITEVESDVKAGAAFCQKMLDSRAVWLADAAGGVTGIPAGIVEMLFAAFQDFQRIEEILYGPGELLRDHLQLTRGDLKKVEDNILGYGWGL